MITLTIVDGKYLDDNGNEHQLPNINLITQAGVVIGFDSVEERKQYIEAMPKQWNKAAYCDAVNEAHNALFESRYRQRDYLAIGEIPIWENDEEFGAESLALQQWWVVTCKTVAAYLDEVTEQTALPVADFIALLPPFISPETPG